MYIVNWKSLFSDIYLLTNEDGFVPTVITMYVYKNKACFKSTLLTPVCSEHHTYVMGEHGWKEHYISEFAAVSEFLSL